MMGRPNILLITTDQQRYDGVAANGNPLIRTPYLDRLAAEGVRFERCYVQGPTCMPSRASLFTGRYVQNHRVWRNGIALDPAQPGLAPALLAAGYETVSIGKLHFLPHIGRDYSRPHPSLEYGFQTVLNSDGGGCYDDDYLIWVTREHPQWLEVMRTPRSGDRGLLDGRSLAAPPEVTHAGWVATESIRFLEARSAKVRSGERPFFLHAGFYGPHPPLFVPAPYDTLYDPAAMPLPRRRRDEMADKSAVLQAAAHRYARVLDDDWRRAKAHYYGLISLVDAQIGRILDALDRFGLAQDTLVTFTSDHGELLGDHFMVGKGPAGYDAITRVPLLLRWPGRGKQGQPDEEHGQGGRHAAGGGESGMGDGLPAGRVIAGMVEQVDLCPTLLTAAGVPVPHGVKGTNLLPLARGLTEEGRLDVLTEYRDTQPERQFSAKTLRTPDFTLTRFRRGAETAEVLIDLRRDPDEFDNVARDPAYAAALDALRRRRLDRLQDAEDDLPPPARAA